MTTRTPTESPSPGGVQIRPGSVADALGFTNEANPAPVRTRGEALTAAIRAAIPPEALASARRSLWWQVRKGLYPVAAWGGLWVAANGMYENGANPWYVPAGAVVVGLGGLALKKLRAWLAKGLWRQNWYGGALALATVWTTAAVQVGPGMNTPMPTLLVLGGAAMSAPWWWYIRPRPIALTYAAPVAAIEAAPVAEVEPEGPHPHQVAWSEENAVGSTEGALARSELVEPEPLFDHQGTPNGMAWVIEGGPKKWTYNKMRSALEDIKGTLDMDFVDELVYLEADRRGRKTRGRLLVLERNPLMDVSYWEGPGLDRATGRVPFAVYPDGSGLAYYILFDPESGAVHDIFVGATGSGKTSGLRLIMGESIAFGSAVLLFDPKGGGDFKDLQSKLYGSYLNKREIFAGLRGVEAVLDERIVMLGEVGPARMGPDYGIPMVHAVIDEMPRVFEIRELGPIVRRIVQEGRAAWMKATVATQRPSVDGAFNDDSDAREQLLSGNVILYRVATSETNRMANSAGLEVAANTLPKYFDEEMTKKTHGLGFVLTGNGRDLVSRTLYMTPEASARLVPAGEQLDARSAAAYERGYLAGLAEYDQKYGGGAAVAPAETPGQDATVIPISSKDDKADKIMALFRERGQLKVADIVDAGVCSMPTAYRLISTLPVEKVADGVYTLKVS